MDLDSLIMVARGERPADLVLRHAQLVNVLSGEVHAADIGIAGGRVLGFGAYEAREEVDLQGCFVCPGFLDAHVHLESSMVRPADFARAVVPRGTTGVVCDPHEIANVLGLDGVRYILEASDGLPLRVYVMAPSCVPATDMETAGAALDAADLQALWGYRRVIGLAEMMNYPGVLYRVPSVLDKLRAAGDRPIDGHAPGLVGLDLNAYIAAGVRSDHETTDLEEAREKVRRGMHLMIREGTTARNLHALLPLVTPTNARNCSFCTDDRHPDTLLTEGHIDDVVRKAIAAGKGRGFDPILAVQMATINTARYFRLRDLGAVAPGYRADLLVLDDLESVAVAQVYVGGELVAEGGRFLPAAGDLPHVALESAMHVDPAAIDFTIPAGEGPARVVGIIPDQVVTENRHLDPATEDGRVVADLARDILKMAVVERHRGTGNVGLGLVQGMGLRQGAMASSVAHDAHNIVVIGVDDEEMRAAVAAVARTGGGQVAVRHGQVVASCPLPIAGLMSDRPIEEVRDQVEALTHAAHGLGCTLADPFMTMSFLALPVIPALKLTDQGLVDVGRFEIVPLFGE
ncbi:MAG: adenine deaminase [Anaerolineae bacterium]|nr:adenine deaminase [Anaerolineae bacterium]